ncbi:DUF262 domain-containing protein [Seleniivibrio woodruffii]|uniref:Uncharacterized protein with ParB-like and HNH nuclease domain n=1 Tax=Seleniivibrio woodruffii TaxID=1078050 RepID=A0A4R1KCC6_9BACT|nr:DUF262 domain-containing protein [Seleniivibrio woodruffii]TCK61690.1 uncharacterized protein with ParB-like and HNH nuclease domain [Seleniivibrio woodruffii]TVZ35195.1 uncharacterized protein with ParB-like and HNH nuclease domain [Seleniivibrio woodruffii]
MKVEARNFNVKKILGMGKFEIPPYQREFDWGIDEVIEFYDDIQNSNLETGYFIGHMVFDGDYNGTDFKVVDGQQRITTITIMLSALRDCLADLDEKDYSEGIHNNYIFKKDENNKEYAILDNKMPYPLLQKYVQRFPGKKEEVIPKRSGERRIKEIYLHMRSIFSKLDVKSLIEFRDKLLNVEIIFVAVSDGADVNEIFQTLNATGKDLTTLDLIKSHIFRKYPKECNINEPEESWNIILENTEGKSAKFLNNFWASRYSKVSDKNLYKAFNAEIVNNASTDIKVFLKNMIDDSEIYNIVTKVDESDWEKDEISIYKSIYTIVNVFSIEVANALLLTLIRDYREKLISQQYVIKILKTMEQYHFFHNAIMSNRSSGLDIMYAKYSRILRDASGKEKKHIAIDAIVKEIKDKFPTKDELNSKFDSKLYYNKQNQKQKKLVQYVLEKIESTKQNNNIKLLQISLEHICPEKPKKGEWVGINPKNISNIGNLVLLDKDLNSSIGNADYTKKRSTILGKSTLLTTKEIFENNTDWDDKAILEHRNSIFENMYSGVWR